MSFKKIDKFFTLSDSSVNVYGFRLLTDGFLMDEYKPNPIGYYMHGETAEHPREQGVLVKWEDLKFDGDKLVGKPCINLNHPRGSKTVEEAENGFLNGASVGQIVLLESREDVIGGEKVLTGTKWYCKEISLVDMPGNRKALAQLFDKDGVAISLADYTPSKNQNSMHKITLAITPALMALLSLSDKSTETDLSKAIENLADQAKKVPALELEKAQAITAKDTAEKTLKDLKDASAVKEIKDLADQGIKDKKLSVALAAKLEKDYAGNPDGFKAVLADMLPQLSLVDKINEGKESVKSLADKSYKELDKSGQLQNLKDNDPELFKQKFKEQYGVDYKG